MNEAQRNECRLDRLVRRLRIWSADDVFPKDYFMAEVRPDLEDAAVCLMLAANYLQRIVDCPLGNGEIKDFRTLAAARELLAGSALDQLYAKTH